MEILEIPIILSAIGNLFLGFFVFIREPVKKLNRLFGIFSFTTAFWVLSNFMAGINPVPFWPKTGYAFGALISASAVLWISELCGITLTKFRITLFTGLGLLFFLISYINDLILKNIRRVYLGGYEGETGPLFSLYAIYIIGTLIFVLYTLLSEYYKSTGLKKLQLSYVVIGSTLFIGVVLIVNFILPLFGIHQFMPLDSPSSLFLIFFTAIAITRFHLFEIRVILTETLVVAIGLTLLIQVLTAPTFGWKIFGFVLLAAFAIMGYLLIKYTYLEIRRRQEIEKIDKAKSEFISIASHQLRTPLTAVKGYISMILEGTYGQLAERQARPLENVYQSNERLIRLVNDLLNLSRLDAGKIEFSPELTSLEEMVSGVVEELRINAEKKGLYMKMIKPSESLPKIMVDQDKLRQVILNIVDNAIKYTKEGGITFELKKLDAQEEIKVSDTGEGMDEGELNSLFQMFSRATAGTQLHAEGAGLGLYVARQFIEMHGGKIWAESPGKGKGSAFIIQLPIKLDSKLIKEKTKIITKAPDDIF